MTHHSQILPLGSPDGHAHSGAEPLAQAGNGMIVVPRGLFLLGAEFSRSGDDLVLSGGEGPPLLLAGYFGAGQPPALVTESGAMLPGELVARLAGPRTPAAYAQAGEAGGPALGEAIGRIESIAGTVELRHGDGTVSSARSGDLLHSHDIIVTGTDSGCGMVLADRTTLALGPNGRMVVDDFHYDPGAARGTAALSVIQGSFSFISGLVAKTAPDAMIVRTPVMSIGVRGTSVAGVANAEGSDNQITLLADPDGAIGQIVIATEGGEVVLSSVLQTVRLSSFFSPPPPPYFLPPGEVYSSYGDALGRMPIQPGSNPLLPSSPPAESGNLGPDASEVRFLPPDLQSPLAVLASVPPTSLSGLQDSLVSLSAETVRILTMGAQTTPPAGPARGEPVAIPPSRPAGDSSSPGGGVNLDGLSRSNLVWVRQSGTDMIVTLADDGEVTVAGQFSSGTTGTLVLTGSDGQVITSYGVVGASGAGVTGGSGDGIGLVIGTLVGDGGVLAAESSGTEYDLFFVGSAAHQTVTGNAGLSSLGTAVGGEVVFTGLDSPVALSVSPPTILAALGGMAVTSVTTGAGGTLTLTVTAANALVFTTTDSDGATVVAGQVVVEDGCLTATACAVTLDNGTVLIAWVGQDDDGNFYVHGQLVSADGASLIGAVVELVSPQAGVIDAIVMSAITSGLYAGGVDLHWSSGGVAYAVTVDALGTPMESAASGGSVYTLYGLDAIVGSNGADTLIGGANQTLIGGRGADSLGAFSADATTQVSYANDSGGQGVVVNLGKSTLSLGAHAVGTITTLAAGTALDSYGDIDTLTGVRAVTGTAYADLIRGGDDALFGGVAYTLIGNGGADTLVGGSADTVFVVDCDLAAKVRGYYAGNGDAVSNTLRFSIDSLGESAAIDLTTLSGHQMSGVDRIDLADDDTALSLTLDPDTVYALASGFDTTPASVDLAICGGDDDCVVLNGSWSLTLSTGGDIYELVANAVSGTAGLDIDRDVNLTLGDSGELTICGNSVAVADAANSYSVSGDYLLADSIEGSTLTLNGGASDAVALGQDGDDRFVIDASSYALSNGSASPTIDGGDGVNTLVVSGSFALDLGETLNFSNIQEIELVSGATITLSDASIAGLLGGKANTALSDTDADLQKTLLIGGESGTSLTLDDDQFTLTSDTITVDNVSYQVYQVSGTDYNVAVDTSHVTVTTV